MLISHASGFIGSARVGRTLARAAGHWLGGQVRMDVIREVMDTTGDLFCSHLWTVALGLWLKFQQNNWTTDKWMWEPVRTFHVSITLTTILLNSRAITDLDLFKNKLHLLVCDQTQSVHCSMANKWHCRNERLTKINSVTDHFAGITASVMTPIYSR